MDVESGLRFDFSSAANWEKLDLPGTSPPVGWKRVDYLVEQEGHALLLEVKNPTQAGATAKNREAFEAQMHTKELVPDLTRKYRDTYCYLHLMARASERTIAVFLVVTDLDTAVLSDLRLRLLARLDQESGHDPWAVKYALDCLVLTPRTWAEHFPQYPLTSI